MKIVGITGRARSGKNTAAEYLVEKYGFAHYNFSDVLVGIAKDRKLKPTKTNLSIVGDELRKKDGMGAVSKLLIKKMKNDENVVVTGFRSPEEVDAFRNEADEFVLIEIKADPKMRYKRDEENVTEDEFYSRDERDIKNKGLGKVLDMADHHIENNGTKKQLSDKLAGILRDEGFVE